MLDLFDAHGVVDCLNAIRPKKLGITCASSTNRDRSRHHNVSIAPSIGTARRLNPLTLQSISQMLIQKATEFNNIAVHSMPLCLTKKG